MTAFDYIVLSILACSGLLSLLRGLIQEIISLLIWIFAFIAAHTFGTPLAALLPSVISGDWLRLLVAFALVLVGSLLILSLFGKLFAQLIKAAGLTLADRGLGALFGLLRGCVMVWSLVIAASMTALPQTAAWQNAQLRPYVESSLKIIQPWLPQTLASHINF